MAVNKTGNKAKQRRMSRNKSKRNVTNQRTFRNVKARRDRHAKNHPDQPHPDKGARRWKLQPTASR